MNVEEEYAQELLQIIVEMWVTIRGFSLTSHWMEQYKQATREELKKKSLRKDLKKKSEE